MSQQEIQVKVPLNAGINIASGYVPEAVQPGELISSNNTRLSVPLYKGTAVRAPAVSVAQDALAGYSGVHGVLPPGDSGRSLICFRPRVGSRVSLSGSSAPLPPTTDTVSLAAQADHTMLEFERAGQSIGGYAHCPSSVYSDGSNVWRASIVAESTNLNLYVSVENAADGSTICSRQFIQTIVIGYTSADINVNGQWCAINVIGGTAFVWYKLGGATGNFAYRPLTLSTASVAVGAQVNIAASAAHFNCLKPDICTDGTYAYLVTTDLAAGVNTTTLVRKIDPVTNITTTLSLLLFTTAVGSLHTFACTLMAYSSARLIVACGTPASTGRVVSIDPATMTLQWTYNTGLAPATISQVTVAPLVLGATAHVVVAFASLGGTGVGAAAYPNTQLCFITDAGAFANTDSFSWMILGGSAATWAISTTEQYPLFPLMRCYAAPTAVPTNAGIVEDPAVSLVLVGGIATGDHSIVARYGVDRMAQPYPSVPTHQWSNTLSVQGDQLFVGYLGERSTLGLYYTDSSSETALRKIAFDTGYPNRDVVLSLASGARRFAHDSSGVALSGTAIPVRWDGSELTEAGWLHKPRIYVDPTGGSSTATWSGTYAFRVVYTSYDATGNLCRSAPSLPYTITPVATKPRLWVAQALTARDGYGVRRYGVEVYVATIVDNSGNPGDGLYYLQSFPVASTNTDGSWTYTVMELPLQGTALLYSDGTGNTELFPIAPPPARDCTFIGSRMWLLDAENNGRVWPSKLKQPGIAVEFASELVLELDGASGGLVGVCEFDGEPLVFAEKGIYRIASEGPNNNLSAGGFSAPRLISAIGCTDKHSIVRFPYGVMFASSEGTFASLTGNGLKRYDNIFTPNTVIGHAVLPSSREIVYALSDTPAMLVYNWEFDRWTSWSVETSVDDYAAFVLGGDGNPLAIADTGEIIAYDLEGFSRAGQLYLTGWIMPAQDDQADCQIRELILQAFTLGTHGLTITAYFDYKTTGGYTASKAYTAAEIAALAPNDRDRYTLRWNLPVKNCRAIQLLIQETEVPDPGTSGGFSPISATLLVGLDQGVKKRATLSGALK